MALTRRRLRAPAYSRFVRPCYSPIHLLTASAEYDSRPALPDNSPFNTKGLRDILRTCWSTKPIQRPTFSQLVKDFEQLRKSSGQEIVDSRISAIDEVPEMASSPLSDMRPTGSTEDMNRKPDVTDYDGYDKRIADIQDEKRYRLSLIHDYHPSRMSF
jgi:hypothetical protein